MARMLAALFASGATLALLSLALPHSPKMDEMAIAVVLSLAYCAALVLATLGPRVPRTAIYVVVLVGSTLIAAGSYFSGEQNSYFSLFYIWSALYVFYFFPLRQAMAQLVSIGVLYGAVLAVTSPPGSLLTPWLLTLGTLTVAGTLVAQLVGEVRGHASALGVVASASHEVLASSDPDAARAAICQSAQTVSGAQAAVLFELAADGSGLAPTAVAGVDLSDGSHCAPQALTGVRGAYRSEQVTFLGNLADRSSGTFHHHDGHVRSVLCEPIIRDGAAIGVLAVGWDRRMRRVPRRAAATIGLLAAEAAVAIEHADLVGRLEAAARTDHLTGLANRRALFDALPRELARSSRSQTPLCLAMLDLDNFKQFNDSHGHQAGDRHLKELAAAWRDCVRPQDLIARYGGEEFTIILPSCDLEDALQVIERVRSSTPAGETCSAGVAEWDGAEMPAELIARTDQALYRAKAEGRDRTCGAGARLG